MAIFLRHLAVRAEGAIFWVLVALVVLAPLPLGGHRVLHTTLFALVAGSLLVAWSLVSTLGPPRARVGLGGIWLLALLFAIAPIWALVQISPLTPIDWHHPMWLLAAQHLGADVAGRISVEPFETEMAITRLLTYGGVFWLAFQLGQSTRRARHVLKAIAMAGLAYAGYGLVRYFLGIDAIAWFGVVAPTDVVTSTFFNRNSYATYAGLGLLCASGLVLTTVFADRARGPRASRSPGWLWIARHGGLQMAGATAMATALVLTQSRAGVASSALGLSVLVVLLAVTGVLRARQVRGTAVAMVGMAVLLVGVAGGELVQRFDDLDEAVEARGEIFRKAWDALEQAPLTGVGYGTFAANFRLHHGNAEAKSAERAHSTYLENLAELGIPAAVALFAAVGGAAVVCVRGLRNRQRDRLYPAVAVAATALVGAHALVDFSLQLPAIALTYAALMGVGCAQSWNSDERGDGIAGLD